MNQSQLEQRFAELSDISRNYAEAAAQYEQLCEYRKVLKARLMQEAEQAKFKTVALQEREAYASEEYETHLTAIHASRESMERLRWELKTIEIRFEAWRTRKATERAEMNLR